MKKQEPNNPSIQYDSAADQETSDQIKNAYESGVVEQNFDENFTEDQTEKADEI
ncbi:hypothetical protein J9317_14620 [Metabacillus sp. KIGAM252]|uniref:DUF4025 domain-containing protein n=1 Tax=Metabacillus flavus TaxID=2823519 RepID=A0ABS5LGX3_9BACI|nr:hypothetical protein [Metabacillus flavus]MBS2970002.1 hypothetical protein [Metabacillus flavus]